ncbi:MAG: prolyl-tRNA synthetase associated domain-containing protein [Cyclobacteriaceae bacterium]|nr:prolyl-tRNA synthetase associated domain-containing protein [Cyclobacteriaceae bacterium]
MIQVEEYLTSRGIGFKVHEHPPVQTCDELAQYGVPGLACKNLFLRDQKKTRYLLVVLPAAQKTDLKKLAEQVGDKKLSFVNPETMMQKLGVEPGAVSPFGILNNAEGDVELWIDREVLEATVVHFHPNRNTASVELTGEMFRRYLLQLGVSYTVL